MQMNRSLCKTDAETGFWPGLHPAFMMLEKGALEASENDIPVYPGEYSCNIRKLKII